MSTWNDVRYSLRALGREPGFAAAAILTVALGVGANTAIFSIVNGVLLRPLPFAAPDRLIALREVVPALAATYPTLPVSARHFVEWRARTSSFERLSAMDPTTATLTDDAQPEQLDAVRVSADIFRTLGVQAALGRTFLDGEDQEGHSGVAVLADSLWRRRFHADPHIVGRTIHLDSRAVMVVGVMPAWFQFPNLMTMETGKGATTRPELFIPAVFRKDELATLMGMFNYNVVARLKPGVPVERARAELDVIAGQLVKLSGEKLELRAGAAPLLDSMTGKSRRGLLVLLGAVGSVLLIVCVNLANLMLARAERQGRDAAIRTALGASPGRLMRQALTQALVIALLGGALGVGVAWAGLGALIASAPADIPRLEEVHLDLRVLLFALGITTLAGLLFGLAPAWHAARTDPQSALKSSGRSSTSGSGGLRLRSALVAAEVGLSGVLLVTGALLMTSFLRIMRSEKGFRAPAVLAAQIQIPRAKYAEDAQSNQFYRRLLERLSGEPGVLSAGIGTQLPLQGETWIDNVSLPGDARPTWQQTTTNVRFISPDYLRTMGIPLRQGRPFNDNDPTTSVIVSETLARLLWHGQDPVGRQLMDGEQKREVIGVAGDVRAEPHKPAVATLYRPYWDWSPRKVMLVARAAGDPRSIVGAMRAAVRSVDPEVPLAEVRTMQEVLEQSVAERRFQMLLAAVFAATALLLTSLGIYGVVSYSVARRTNEMGIRLALGAQPHDVYGLVLRQAMTPVVAGLAVGLAGAVAAGTLLAGLLYEVRPNDPATIGAVALVLAAVGLAASFTPARRALRADPIAALRQE
jgi:putative ABC transport system permease protein